MAPKLIKKTEKTEEPVVNIDQLMKEWADIAKEEATIDEAKNKIIKRKEAMITKLWDHLNKNPTEQVLAEKPVEKVVEPVAEKPKATAKAKKSKASEEEVVEEAPKPVKKSPVKKAAASKEEKPVVEEPVKSKTAPTKKVAAPPKGSVKPKSSSEIEVKKLEHESSSETDVESLSSVSSESEGSDGGEE